MSLQIPRGEKVYIDTSIFIRHHSKDLEYKHECTAFLSEVERGKWEAFISFLVIDEASYILLKYRAAELLKTYDLQKILQGLKRTKLHEKAWATAQLHIDYVLGLRDKGVLKIIEQMPKPEEFARNARKYGLLPRDAIHVSLMLAHGIVNIATTDRNFDKVKGIKAWKPWDDLNL